MERTKTEKLYYQDAHLRQFSATVTGCEKSEKGWLITLSATAFYPEGGGQAADTGTLGGVKVIDVQEHDGDIFHLCDSALEVGTTVEGYIDWEHRFDLMQQHTGEHIVSGLLHEKFGCMNTGFHVGSDVMEVDFDAPMTMADLFDIERRANEAIWKNLPLKCWIPGKEELKTVTYRTKRPLPWPVRIVQVPGFDSCACCGIHVKTTGEVGLIKILSCTALRGGVRLEMVCGSRAYRHIAAIFEENRQVSQLLSAPMGETGEAARKLTAALAAEKQRTVALQRKLFDHVAQRYENTGDVLHFEGELESSEVRLLAEKILAGCGGRAFIFSGTDGAYSYCLASKAEDLRPLNKAMTEALQGRGGGKPLFQQGKVQATTQQICDFFADRLTLL